MELKPGDRLASAVGDSEMVVIRAPAGDLALTSGGRPVRRAGDGGAGQEILPGHEGEVLLGKRYVDEGDSLELLCTKPGNGALEVDGRPLGPKTAKPLPSSD